MRDWLARQYEDVRGNFKWGLLMFLWWLLTTYGKKALTLIPHVPLWTVNVGLFVLALIGFIWIATLVARSQQPITKAEDDNTDFKQLFLDEQFSREKYQDQFVMAREERDQLKNEVEQLKAQKPDTSVKDSDPQLEIKVADLRGRTMSDKPMEQACFALINRGKQSPAQFACIEDFNIGGYRVAFRTFPPPIRPFGNHDSVIPSYINKPDGKLCDKDIFTVFFYAWDDLKNDKLYEYSIPIKATYQDEARNLFEVRCDLVFYPHEHANHQHPQLGHSAGTILETKNHKIRKVAAAATPVNWSD